MRQGLISQVRAMLEKEVANFQESLQKCINENGHYMKDIVF